MRKAIKLNFTPKCEFQGNFGQRFNRKNNFWFSYKRCEKSHLIAILIVLDKYFISKKFPKSFFLILKPFDFANQVFEQFFDPLRIDLRTKLKCKKSPFGHLITNVYQKVKLLLLLIGTIIAANYLTSCFYFENVNQTLRFENRFRNLNS